MTRDLASYLLEHTPTLLLVQALRAAPGAKLDLDAAIRATAALYDRVTAVCANAAPPSPVGAGSPALKPCARRDPATRTTTDHLAALAPEDRARFEAFYSAYGVLKGKQRAAARWAEIAPDAALAKAIIDAAGRDRLAPRPPDAVRKYPEGWLSERRWEDGGTAGAAADPVAERRAEIAELMGRWSALARLISQNDPRVHAEMQDCELRLAAMGISPDQLLAASPPKPSGLRPVGDLAKAIRSKAAP